MGNYYKNNRTQRISAVGGRKMTALPSHFKKERKLRPQAGDKVKEILCGSMFRLVEVLLGHFQTGLD